MNYDVVDANNNALKDAGATFIYLGSAGIATQSLVQASKYNMQKYII